MTVELWYVDLDDIAGRPDGLGPVTAGDRGMAERLVSDVLRRRFLGRRAAARHVLGQSLGLAPADLEIVRRCRHCGASDHGRPSVRDAPGDFSVTASGGIAVIAVADHPVGVDLEIVPPAGSPSTVIPRRVLTAGERALLDPLLPLQREPMFLRMWAIKEAVLKAEGSGLALEPTLVDTTAVAINPSGYVGLGGQSWTVRSMTRPPELAVDAVLAVAGTKELSISWRFVRW